MQMPGYRFTPLKESLLELSQLGSPVDLEVVSEVRSCRLEIVQSDYSRMFELENGRTGYMLGLWLANQTSRSMYAVDIELCLPGEEQPIEWLQPCTMQLTNRKEGRKRSFEHYRFPGRTGDELPFDQVINHHLTPDRALPPCRPISGWLLGIGGLMPPHLFHGGAIEATIVIWTSDHAEHSAPIVFGTERLEHKVKREGPRPSSLFADPVLEGKPNKSPRVPPRSAENVNRREINVRGRNATT